MRKAFAVALLSAVVCVVGIAKDAGAAVTFTFVFINSTGLGITGTNVIDARLGDALTVQIRMTTDQTLSGHSVSLNFDTDLGNELNLFNPTTGHNWEGFKFGIGAFGPSYGPIAPVGPQIESVDGAAGQILSFNSEIITGTRFLPTGTYAIGTAKFVWTGSVGGNADINLGLFNFGVDGVRDNAYQLIPGGALFFPTASINGVDGTSPPDATGSQGSTYTGKWGTFGSNIRQFIDPFGIAVDSGSNVYVADSANHRIQVFTKTGAYVTQWGSFGTANGYFKFPHGVAVGSGGNVYVADTSNQRIQVFTSTGTYLTQWGSLGSGNGQFNNPYGVAVGSGGNVYVADTSNQRIQVFTSTGAYRTKWGTAGIENRQFKNPIGVAVDTLGNVYVADSSNYRIQVFTSVGSSLTKWGSFGSGNGQFKGPRGVAVDTARNIYVVDTFNASIQTFETVTIEAPALGESSLAVLITVLVISGAVLIMRREREGMSSLV